MDYRPLPLDAFPEKLRRNVDPDSPAPMRLMAARGLLPAPPAEMAMVLFQLTFDLDTAISAQAKKTLADSPPAIIEAAAAAELPATVLDLIARTRRKDRRVLEAVLQNKATADETIAELAKTVNESLTELIAINEVRLLRSPRIIENLYLNPAARMSTVDRLVDLAARNGVKFENQALQGLLDDPGYDTTEAAAEAISREFDDEGDNVFKIVLDKSIESEEEAAAEPEDEEEGTEKPRDDGKETKPQETAEEKKTTNLAAAILHMTISEKMRLAMLGSQAEREFLIKDNNRLVHMAAVMSPKVRLKEVQGWSGNRLMPDNVLSYIANHRRYRRVYQIIVNLTNNPKTPVKDSMRLFPQLVAKDLKALVKNRNIPHQVRRQAKSMMEERERKMRGKK